MSVTSPAALPLVGPEARRRHIALVTLVTGACLIGFSPIFVRLSEVGPIATAFHRMVLALPLFALWGLRERRGAEPSASAGAARPAWGWLFAAGLGLGFDLALWHLSLAHISVVNATLLANLAPVFVTLAAWLWLGERITRRFIGGLAVAIAGTWVLVFGSGRAEATTDGQVWLGTAQALGAALFYAGYILAMKRARRGASLATTMLGSGAATLATLAPLVLLSGEVFWPGSAWGWLVLLGLAWLPQGLGQGLIVHGLAVLPASFSALTLLIQPVVAALLAWVLLGETLAALQALGGALVLGGIALARR